MINPESLAGSIQLDGSFNQKLNEKGVLPGNYFAAYYAFQNADKMVLARLADVKTEALKSFSTRDEYFDSKTGLYVPERIKLHDDIVDLFLSGKKSLERPELSIEGGPPGAGKSTLRSIIVEEYSNVVSTDPDLIRPLLLAGYDEKNAQDVLKTRDEAFDISQRIMDEAIAQNMSITCESTLRDLGWINDAFSEVWARNYKVVVDYIYRPLEECFYNDVLKRKKSVPLKLFMDSTQGVDNFLTLANNPVIHKISMYDASHVYTKSPALVMSRHDEHPTVMNEARLREIQRYMARFR